MDMLGMKVKDKITGFEGVATGFVVYISGCNQYLVCPQVTKDHEVNSKWFDEQRLEVTDKNAIKLDNSKTPGAGEEAPVR